MDIIDKRPAQPVWTVKHTEKGQVFEYQRQTYIRTQKNSIFTENNQYKYEVFCFNDLCVYFLLGNQQVKPLKAELHLIN